MASPVHFYQERRVTSSPKVQSLPEIEIEEWLCHIMSQHQPGGRMNHHDILHRQAPRPEGVLWSNQRPCGLLGVLMTDRRHSMWKQPSKDMQHHPGAVLRALSGTVS